MIRGGPELARGGLPWPTGPQADLLRAAIGPAEGVAGAFASWVARTDIEGHVDGGAYRLFPLVYERMGALGIDHPLMGRLKGVYRRIWVETQALFHEVAPVVAALEAAGVRTLLLKGVPLALTYYRSHATRPMFDLDLLVPFDQRDQADEVLRAAGWSPGSRVRPNELADQHGLDYRNSRDREADLHWHCLREAPSTLADDWFWRDARPLDFMGVKTLQLRPTAMLLHIIVHGVRSNVEPPIRWIVDAATVLRAEPEAIDWDDLVAFARSQRLCHRLGLGLAYLRDTHGLPVPERVLAALRASGVSLIERIENIVYLGDAETAYRPKLFPLIDYWRYLRNESPWAFARGYSAYLQRRWKLDSPLQIPLVALGLLGRRGVPRHVET